MQYEEEEDDMLTRLMAEHAEENNRRYGGGGEAEEGEAEAPTAPVRRVRIPTTPASGAPAPARPTEGESFDSQLAALLGEDEGESAPPGPPTKVKREVASVKRAVKAIAETSSREDRARPARHPAHRSTPRRPDTLALTLEDKRLLLFISVCRYVPARTAALLLGRPHGVVGRRLETLWVRDYLFKRTDVLRQGVYALTPQAHRIIGSHLAPEKPDYSKSLVDHNVTCANVLALLVAGDRKLCQGVTLDDYSVATHFLTDKMLTREVNSFNTQTNDGKFSYKWDATFLWSAKYALTSRWGKGESTEGGATWEAANPWTWLALRNEDVEKSGEFPVALDGGELRTQTWSVHEFASHVPDLILTYPRDPQTRLPRAVALEVEMTDVSPKKIRDAIACYRDEMDRGPAGSFAQVVWLCKTEAVLATVQGLMLQLLTGKHRGKFDARLLPEVALTGVSYPERERSLSPDQKAERNARLLHARFNGGLTRLERTDATAAKAVEGGE